MSSDAEPLTAATLAEIDRALCALVDLASPPAMRWALAASWALADDHILHCLVSTTHFIAVGGGGWARLGYEAQAVEWTPWSRYLASVDDVASSHDVVASNVAENRGVERFENVYRHADGVTSSRIAWRISPWHDGYAVATGVICGESK
jgi:hypothetical protein